MRESGLNAGNVHFGARSKIVGRLGERQLDFLGRLVDK
jgi:hypothetical protein